MKTNFMQLLKETADIDRQSKWSDIKKKIDSDPRYKAVDSSSRREDWFKDYVRTLEKVSIQFKTGNSYRKRDIFCCRSK